MESQYRLPIVGREKAEAPKRAKNTLGEKLKGGTPVRPTHFAVGISLDIHLIYIVRRKEGFYSVVH